MAIYNGTPGNDLINRTGDTTAHIIRGFEGDDTLIGGSGSDYIFGDAGNDLIDGGLGNDNMTGGIGDDTYTIDAIGDKVTELANEGMDLIKSSIALDLNIVSAHVENLTLTGTANINATGNALNNLLKGNSGNNTLDGGSGEDLMNGGAGDDTYIVDNVADVVYENPGNGMDRVLSSVSYQLFNNGVGGASGEVEALTLTGTANISATGNALTNYLIGNSGANVLDGGAGRDIMNGMEGDDLYIVDDVTDLVLENAGQGIDAVRSSVSFELFQNLSTNGGAVGEFETLILTGTGNTNGTGNGLNNLMVGNSGSNVLDGGAGTDTMLGAAGNDIYMVDNAGDVVFEDGTGGNTDVDAVFASTSYSLANAGTIENLLLTGTASSGTGNGLNNKITGNSGANVLNGGAGNDTLSGNTGGDSYLQYAGFGADTIVDTDTNTANIDKLAFLDASYNQLWFKQIGSNLEISVVGASDKVTVQNWFTGTANQLELTRDAGLAHTLAANKVAGLVSAMSAFAPQDLSGNATLIAARDAAWV